MAEVKVLIEGFTNADSKKRGEEEKTCATITLVKDRNVIMIVDPGVLDSQDTLIKKLKEEVLTVNDVNIVCITHSHVDHYRNLGMFPKAKTLEYWGLWEGGSVEDWKEQFTDDIKIIKTPGHSYDGISLLVKTKKGTIAVVGDVFWKENFPIDDPYANDKEKLKESRKKVLELADYVIPGHGKMFKVKK
jgi:glyoxylase-like metal-dependent hydrolase (beta-lactamase superfamily II)